MILKKAHTLLIALSESVPHTEMINSLRTSEYNLLESKTGGEILQTLCEHSEIDLIMITVDISGMDGIETILAIRKQYIKIPIILLLNHVTIESVRLAQNIGCNEIIQAPVDHKTLEAIILKYLPIP
jgi:two-component system response regulator AtoC